MMVASSSGTRSWGLIIATAVCFVLIGSLGPVARASDFGGVSNPEPPDCPNPLKAECNPDPCKEKKCCNQPNSGGRVSLLSGRERHLATDLTAGTLFPIELTRQYDSATTFDTALGYGWAFDFDRRIFEYADNSIVLRRGCGQRDSFVLTGGAYQAPRDGVQAEVIENADGTFDIRYDDGSRDLFDADGRLVQEQSREGQWHEFVYDERGRLPLVGTSVHAIDPNKPMVVAYQPRLLRINERSADGAATGHYVEFSYDETTGRLQSATTSDGRVATYQHDVFDDSTRGNLMSVSGASVAEMTYAYSDTDNPHRLTSIQSAGGALQTLTYDAYGRVVRETIGDTELTIDYSAALQRTVLTRTIKGPDGEVLHRAATTYEFDADSYLTKEIDPLGNEVRHSYDGAKNRVRTELWDHSSGSLVLLKATNWTYDSRGRRLTEQVEVSDSEQITTTWTYDGSWVASEETASSAAPDKVFRTDFSFVRDSAGRPFAIASQTRHNDAGDDAVTTYAYCEQTDITDQSARCPFVGLLKTIDGPRIDVQDVTRYEYYVSSDTSGCAMGTGACYRKGYLHRVVNAAGHATEYLKYDNAGRAVRIMDPNGVTTDLDYHQRGWLVSRIVRGLDNAATWDDAVTRFEYDVRGNPVRIVAADGTDAEMTYDNRSRLISIRDAIGNRVLFTRDSDGKVLKKEVIDQSGTVRRRSSQALNALGQVTAIVGAHGQTTRLAYDAADRLSHEIDSRGVKTQHQYDSLGRLVQTLEDVQGITAKTTYAYDAVGGLARIVDPNQLETVYRYNTIGQPIEVRSPDSGVTVFQYDLAGNRAIERDSRGVEIGYDYDALNRLTASSTSSSSEGAVFKYDQVQSECLDEERFAEGRLARATDESGETRWCYDRVGRVTRKTQVLAGGPDLSAAYVYTGAGRLQTLTYPSGSSVTYERDRGGRVSKVLYTPSVGLEAIALITDVDYAPFGPAIRIQFGNGRVLSKDYDQNYNLSRLADNKHSLEISYSRDSAGYVVGLNERHGDGAVNRAIDHDGLAQLAQVRDDDGAVESYSYDRTGNRSSKTSGSTETYAYAAGSNQLTRAGEDGRTYDAAGNTTLIRGLELAYDARGRLKSVLANGLEKARYRYNVRGERVFKIANGIGRAFYYDESSRLLGEYDLAGNRVKEYVWLDNVLVAIVGSHSGADYQYVFADHLGTPRAVVEPNRDVVVWRWAITESAFGDHAAELDPDGDGAAYELNIRFPGQYFDAESGLHYNLHRNYDPTTGRYIEVDPLGLWAGLATYAYSYSSPLEWFDPKGLNPRGGRGGNGSGNGGITTGSGAGGNSADRRRADREHMRNPETHERPDLTEPRTIDEDNPAPVPNSLDNPLSPWEGLCRYYANNDVDVCGPGPRMRWVCGEIECWNPPPQSCRADDPPNGWRPPGHMVGPPGSSPLDNPNCRCKWGYFDSKY